ncbi:MAG: GNAT family N-acetyltransferase [Gammaproteobacteria bacterium]
MDEAGAFTVREPTARDLPLLKAVLSEWVPPEWQPGAGASAHRWLMLVQRGDGAEAPAGIAEYQQIVDEGHLLGIAIVPALRGRGLGMILLQAVLDEMRAAGCTRCLLEVRRSNVAAQALYGRARFTLDGIRKDYYPPQGPGQREDALLYSRVL